MNYIRQINQPNRLLFGIEAEVCLLPWCMFLDWLLSWCMFLDWLFVHSSIGFCFTSRDHWGMFNTKIQTKGKTELPGMKGNFRGKRGRNTPFWIFQSDAFRLAASSFSKTSSFLGLGIGTLTCCKKTCITIYQDSSRIWENSTQKHR